MKSLSESIKRMIEAEAARQDVPEAQIVQEAVECYIECLDAMDRQARPERRCATVSP